jgi:hypothetical protein
MNRSFEARLSGEFRELSVSRQEVVDLLTERGMYRALEGCQREVLSGATRGEAVAGASWRGVVGATGR